MAGVYFTESEKMFQKQMREIAEREFAPGAKERAKLKEIPEEILKRLGELGITGIGIPEELGGQPGNNIMRGIATEELGRVDNALAMVIVNRAATVLMFLDASEKIKRLLPSIIKFELKTCVCITEPGCGSDAAAIQTRAVKDGDYYVLTGEKTSATFGFTADAAIVFATVDPAAKARGISTFFVPMDLPNIHRSLIPDMGCTPINRASVILDGVRIPAKNRIGEEGSAFPTIMRHLDIDRSLNALGSIAMAQASLEETAEYATFRYAFGNPISKYQAVSFKLAEDATLLEAARLLCYETLAMADKGLSVATEGAMAKWFSNEVAFRTIHDCLLVYGHIGFSEESAIQQRLRDVIGWEIADGAINVQKLIIARGLMGRDAV